MGAGVARSWVDVDMTHEEWERRIHPKHDWVFVRRVDVDQTEAGIKLVNAQQHEPYNAIVVSTGPGIVREGGKFVEPCVRVGDRVILNPMNQHIIPFNIRTKNENRRQWVYYMVSERTILADYHEEH